MYGDEDEYLQLEIVLQTDHIKKLKSHMTLEDIKNLSDDYLSYIMKELKFIIELKNCFASSNVEYIYELYNIDSYDISREELYSITANYLKKRINNPNIIKSLNFIFLDPKTLHYEESYITFNILLEDIYKAYKEK